MILIAVLLMLMAACSGAQDGAISPDQPVITKHVLDDGLTAIIKPEPGSGLVAVVAMVKVGANQEQIRVPGHRAVCHSAFAGRVDTAAGRGGGRIAG